MTTPDRDSLTPITPLSARMKLEETIRDVEELSKNQGSIVAELVQVKQVAVDTAKAVSAHLKSEQSRMSPAAIKAWGATAVLVLGGLQTLLTTVRMNEAAAQAKTQQAEVVRQERLRTDEVSQDLAIKRVAAQVARESEERWQARLEAQRVELERRASMRVPKR